MNSDDDRTRIIGQPTSTKSSGSENVLPSHSRIDEFEIVNLIGEGGFGIVYLALDHSLERHVALKEYMPSSLAMRGPGLRVSVKSPRQAQTFEAGLRSFVNEAKLLAHFDHPALVKVHRFWEANGTAYMVMPLYKGMTLKHALGELPERPSEEWLKTLLRPLIDALELMHERQCFHRDIAPDNLLVLEDGKPMLLDFGAARRVIGDMTQALTVILKPGFAPVEQYAEVPELKQGAWTDVYALAALIYFAISGRAPTPSVARMMNDTLIPAAQLGAGRYSKEFLSAIDAALVVHPDQRTASMAQFKADLGLDQPSIRHRVSYQQADVGGGPAAGAAAGLEVSSEVGAGASIEEPGQAHTTSVLPTAIAADKPASPARAKRGLMITAVLVLAAALIGTFIWRSNTSENSSALAGGNQPVSVAESLGDTKPAVQAKADATPSSPPTAATEAAEQTRTAAKPPFSPALINELVYQARSPDWQLLAEATPRRAEIAKDFIRFDIRSQRAGYLYIFMLGSDPNDWMLIFPNGKDRDNRLIPGKALLLPRKSWPIQSSGPPGTTRFLALASEAERSFAAGGLKLTQEFGKFDQDIAATAYRNAVDPAALFAGTSVCPNTSTACSNTYGATRFEIEEFAR